MGRRSFNKDKYEIVSTHGEIYVYIKQSVIFYRPFFWIFKINPLFLLPGLRSDFKKKCFANGRKYGYAMYKGGAIPLPDYDVCGNGFFNLLHSWFRRRLGIFCKRRDRGYYYIKLHKNEFICLRHYTNEGNLYCDVYFKNDGRHMGAFIFDKEFNNVYAKIGENTLRNTLFMIMGYVADVCIYEAAADSLNRKIKIVI